MSDYTQVNDYSDKDALATGNPLKIIKGSDIDAELSGIATAIATKFDSTSIASAAEAAAGTLNTVVMTPGRVTSWAQANAGVVYDLQQLADPGADRILFWDESAPDATTWLTVGAGLAITGTTLAVSGGAATPVDETRTLTAGNGLSGGGDLSADRTFDLDFNELAALTIAAGDLLALADVDDSNTVKKVAFSTFEAALSLANLGTGTTLTAGTGLSYSVGSGDLTANNTIDLDLNELTTATSVDFAADFIPFYDTDAAVEKKILPDDLFGAALGDGRWYRSAALSLSTAASKITWDATTYDELKRGTFASGTYTRGSVAGRIQIYAQYQVPNMNDDESLYIYIYKNGAEYQVFRYWNDSDGNAPVMMIAISGVLNLAASDTVDIYGKVSTGAGEALTVGSSATNMYIIELS